MRIALLILAWVGQEDKIGKDKAPVVVKKSLAEVGKKKGFHFQEKVAITAPQSVSTEFKGVEKKDFAAASGTAEVYAKGSVTLVESGGRFLAPDRLPGQEGIEAGSFRNPALFWNDIARLAGNASWGNDVEIDGKSCKEADLTADEALVKLQIKEFADKLGDQLKQVGNITGYIDTKKTTSTYKVYIGRADLLVYKIEWILKPVIKENSIPPNVPVPNLDNLEMKSEISISKYDEELDITIPREIQQKFGVK